MDLQDRINYFRSLSGTLNGEDVAQLLEQIQKEMNAVAKDWRDYVIANRLQSTLYPTLNSKGKFRYIPVRHVDAFIARHFNIKD